MATKVSFAQTFIIFFGLASLCAFGLAGSRWFTAQGAGFLAIAATRTRTPSRTPTRTPTRTATPTKGRMTVNSLNKVNTGEIIEEMDVFGWGGGAGNNCRDPQTYPILDETVTFGRLMKPVNLLSCGWQPGEIVTVTMRNPLGKIQSFKMKAEIPNSGKNKSGHVDLDYQPPIDAPTGSYSFTFQGKSVKLSALIYFSRPTGAHLVALSGDPFHAIWGLPSGGSQRLLLFGFTPKEPIRLIVYRVLGLKSFYGYQDFVAGSDGRLQIDVNLSGIGATEDLFFLAYGKKSGNVPLAYFLNGVDMEILLGSWDFYCPGAMLSRIDVHYPRLRAAYVDGTKLRIREKPGFDSRVLQSVPEGTKFSYSPRPVCEDNTFWWEVVLPDNHATGWVAETYKGKYIIESVE